MNKVTFKKSVLTIFLISFFSVQSASAFEGLSIGLGYNTAAFMGTGKETMTGSGEDTTKPKITEEDGAFTDEVGSAFVEYDTGPVSIGVEYYLGDIATPSNTNTHDNNNAEGTVNTVKAVFKDHITIYANIDMPYNTYLKLGYQQVDVETGENLATGSAYGNVDTDGYTLGLGYNHVVDNGMFLRAEVAAHSYGDVSATSTEDNTKKVDVTDMYGATASIKIGKTF